MQNRVREEINAAVTTRDVTSEHLDTLPLTRAVFYEAMRLYPPAPKWCAIASLTPNSQESH